MINFSKVEHSVRELNKQVATGEIDQATFDSRLLALIDIAPDGYYWMFGHKTETWYRHDGEQWVQKDPGNLRLLASEDDEVPPHESNLSGNPGDESEFSPAPEESLSSEWRSISWGWFITSLIVIGLIGWIVYVASLP